MSKRQHPTDQLQLNTIRDRWTCGHGHSSQNQNAQVWMLALLLLAVLPWASHTTSLGLSFLFYKMGIMMIFTLKDCFSEPMCKRTSLFSVFWDRFLCVTALTALEPALLTRLASNSQRSSRLCFPSAGIKGMCHHCHAQKVVIIMLRTFKNQLSHPLILSSYDAKLDHQKF